MVDHLFEGTQILTQLQCSGWRLPHVNTLKLIIIYVTFKVFPDAVLCDHSISNYIDYENKKHLDLYILYIVFYYICTIVYLFVYYVTIILTSMYIYSYTNCIDTGTTTKTRHISDVDSV